MIKIPEIFEDFDSIYREVGSIMLLASVPSYVAGRIIVTLRRMKKISCSTEELIEFLEKCDPIEDKNLHSVFSIKIEFIIAMGALYHRESFESFYALAKIKSNNYWICEIRDSLIMRSIEDMFYKDVEE